MKYFSVIILLLSFGIYCSQSNNIEKQFGLSFGTIIPINYFGAGPLELDSEHSSIILGSKIGYQFGMVIKSNYGKRFSIENGISFYRRNFKLNGSSEFNGASSIDSSDFGYISYGLPIKGIVYIQLDKLLFMSTSIGANLDFYASAVGSKGKAYFIDHISDRARWINGSISSDIGFEFRNENKGTFHIGLGVNIPISTIAVTKLRYYYNSANTTQYDRYEDIFLRGNFFNLKLKYYLPTVSNQKNT
jgi:hypothetical protein